MSLRFLTLILLAATAVYSQTAEVSGRVADSSNAVVPDVTITVTHNETGTQRSTQTNDTGYYAVPLLQPGTYGLNVEKSGFKKITRSGVRLEVGQAARLDFTLDIGTTVESVNVTSDAPLVSLSDATLGRVIENQRIANLPLNGRNALSLVMLTPNVRFHATSPSGFADRGATLAAFSVNGGPSGANNITLDGTTNINSRSGDVNVNPAVDAVEEFKVQSGTMSAEHGFTAGGVVSLVSKSGTNQFHGSLYHFLRNDKLDARNTFAATKAPLRYNQFGGSLGGPVIKDRTFFFFNYEQWRYAESYTALGNTPTAAERAGDFSNLRDARGVLIPIFDPLTTEANPAGGGFRRTAFPDNRIPASRLDRVSRSILDYWPLPNRTPDNVFTNQNNFTANLGSFKKATQINTKGDHSFSEKNRLSFRYTLWDHRDDQASNGRGIFPDRIARVRDDQYINRNFNLTDQHFFSPAVINEFRAGLSWLDFNFAPLSYGGDYTTKFGLPSSVPNLIMPRTTITGYQMFPTSFLGTVGDIGLQTYQITDSLTWIRGSHTLKFGGDIRRYLTNLNLCQQCSGTFNFNNRLTANPQALAGTGSALASFMVGAVANASIDQNSGGSYLSHSQSYFIQDDWKVTSRLTLNLGLRYDYQQVPAERNNGLSNFNPDAIDPNNGLRGRLEYAGVDFGKTLQDPDFNDFGPRFGFAYDLFGSGRTVIRGGYGMYYPLTAIFANSYATLGFRPNITNYVAPGGNQDAASFYFQNGFPTPVVPPLGSKLGPSAFLSQTVTTQERNGRTPYAQQYSLTLQQQVKGFLLEAGYSGNKGTKLRAGGWDLNQLDPQYLSLGRSLLDTVPNPYAGRVPGAFGGATLTRQQSLKPFPYYNAINVNQPHYGSSSYHSFMLNAEKRMSNGLVFLASYTFGKLISDAVVGSEFGTGLEGVNVTGFQDGKYNRDLERSLEATDSGRRFVFSGIYELPFGRGKQFDPANKIVNALVGGWQINSILTLQDGLPLVVRGATNNSANRPNSTGVSAELSGDERSRLRWFDTSQFVNPPDFTFGNVGRTLPDVRSPGIINLDASVSKNLNLTEQWRLQFRAEAFNLPNHVNYFGPDTTFRAGTDGRNNSGSFGVIDRARDPRIVQLGLKLIF